MMTGRHAGMLAILAATAVVSSGCDAPAPAAAQVPSSDALEARIKALEALIPDQAHIMADVGDHFSNLWFAGTAENWPLADFCLAETKSHLRGPFAASRSARIMPGGTSTSGISSKPSRTLSSRSSSRSSTARTRRASSGRTRRA